MTDQRFGFGKGEPDLIFEIVSDDDLIIFDLILFIVFFKIGDILMNDFVGLMLKCVPSTSIEN